MALRERQERLLLALRELEAAGASQEPRDFYAVIVQKTQYRPKTVPTYLSKRLDGRLIHRDASGRIRVTGALACTEEDFARLMSQNLPGSELPVFEGREDWRRALLALVQVGIEKGYSLDESDGDLLLDLI
jgi:hypothetical protein